MSDDLDFDMEVVENHKSEPSSSNGEKENYIEKSRAPVGDWEKVQLREVVHRRSENVDPSETDLDRHVGLEHISSGDPAPNFGSIDGQSSTKRHFLPGDVLFGKLRPYLEKVAQPDFEGLCTSEIFSIVAEEAINAKFLLYRLSSKRAVDYAVRTSIGTRMPRTSWGLFENFEFELPPLPEQRKIASVLYTVDQAIQKTEAIIEQTQRVKRGLMQDLMRSGLYEHDLVETETRFGALPDSWEVKQLKEVGEIAGRTAPEKEDSECWGGDIPWATPSEITNLEGNTISETKEYLTERALEKVSSNLLPTGSVLLTTRATVGACAVNTMPMTTNQGFKNVIPGKELDTWYAYYRLTYEADQLEARGKGSTFREVGKETVENFEIPVPPLEEQREIGKILRSIDDQILNDKTIVSEHKQLKKGLMQDLLTGEVRTADKAIKVLDEVAAHG